MFLFLVLWSLSHMSCKWNQLLKHVTVTWQPLVIISKWQWDPTDAIARVISWHIFRLYSKGRFYIYLFFTFTRLSLLSAQMEKICVRSLVNKTKHGEKCFYTSKIITTLQPLYNTAHYNTVLDITRFKDGSQNCIDYVEKWPLTINGHFSI